MALRKRASASAHSAEDTPNALAQQLPLLPGVYGVKGTRHIIRPIMCIAINRRPRAEARQRVAVAVKVILVRLVSFLTHTQSVPQYANGLNESPSKSSCSQIVLNCSGEYF